MAEHSMGELPWQKHQATVHFSFPASAPICFFIDVFTGECIRVDECYRVDGETDILTAEDVEHYWKEVYEADLKEVTSFVNNKIFEDKTSKY